VESGFLIETPLRSHPDVSATFDIRESQFVEPGECPFCWGWHKCEQKPYSRGNGNEHRQQTPPPVAKTILFISFLRPHFCLNVVGLRIPFTAPEEVQQVYPGCRLPKPVEIVPPPPQAQV